ncbi:ArsA family ATPase, partial [Streptomonospora algeriensis]
ARRLREDAAVHLVLLPRRMVLAETERAADVLAEAGFHLGPVVLNQVPEHPDGAVVEAVRRRFGGCGIHCCRLREEEPTGAKRLRRIAPGRL